jgi:hypothetical protein
VVENADNACGAGQGPQGPQNGVGSTGLSSLDISQFESDHPGKLNSPAVMLSRTSMPGSSGEIIAAFVGISGRDEPRVLLLPAATAAKLDLVYVHDTHDVSRIPMMCLV